MLKRKKKRQPDEFVPIIASISIIIFISSVFIPFIIITIIQDIFFRPEGDVWLFQAPVTSYYIVGIASVYISLVVGALAFIQAKFNYKTLFKTIITSLAMLPAIITIYFASSNYYYFTDEGIFQRTGVSVGEEVYLWDNDFKEATFISKNINHSTKLYQVEFKTTSGAILTYDFNDELRSKRHMIKYRLEDAGIEIKNVEVD